MNGFGWQNCYRHNGPEGWVQLTKVSQPRFNFMTLQISFPAAKCWPNSSSKILPELQLQNLDQTLCSKSEPKFSSITKPQLPNMQQTVANKVLIINISNSYNINNAGGGGRRVSLRRSCKMLFRCVGLRSIGPSSQKLWPYQILDDFPIAITM